MTMSSIARATAVIATLALAACQPTPAATSSGRVIPEGVAPGADVTWIADDRLGNDVSRLCDQGRAIYVIDGFQSVGVAVVENAPECA